jgi:hypothetical protein
MSPILESFFSKMRGYLRVRCEGTWEMAAVTRLVLKLSIKWKRGFNFKPWPVLSWEYLQIPSDREHCGFQNVWEFRKSDRSVNRDGSQTACHFSVVHPVL